MAIAMKCDRCGKFYEHYAGYKEFNNSEKANAFVLMDRDSDNIYRTRKLYDLCIDCMRKLEAFIKNEEDEIKD